MSNLKKRDFELPGGMTTVYQSNRITHGTFEGFSLLHLRIFIGVIKQLQSGIKAEINGVDWEQLNLFDNKDNGVISVSIPLSEIATDQNYKRVITAAAEISNLTVELKSSGDKEASKWIKIRKLFAGFDVPVIPTGKKVIRVHILDDVAHELISLDKNKIGNKGTNYTKYLYEIAMSSSSKYTTKLYMLISSWKTAGGFYISLDDLRKKLDIGPNEYPNYAHFKQRVLIPAQKELKERADCWFNCAEKSFESKIGRKVNGLNFKVITKADKDHEDLLKEHIKELLRNHIFFNKEEIDKITELFNENAVDLNSMMLKIVELSTLRTDAKGKEIENRQSYVLKSLLSEFSKPKA